MTSCIVIDREHWFISCLSKLCIFFPHLVTLMTSKSSNSKRLQRYNQRYNIGFIIKWIIIIIKMTMIIFSRNLCTCMLCAAILSADFWLTVWPIIMIFAVIMAIYFKLLYYFIFINITISWNLIGSEAAELWHNSCWAERLHNCLPVIHA